MTTVHILANGFEGPNGRAFLFPIIRHREALRSIGVRYQLFEKVEPALTECDTLIVDSKFHSGRYTGLRPPAWTSEVLDRLDAFRQKVRRLVWFDNYESSGSMQPSVMPFVDAYYKQQLLKDRSTYLRPLYGGRLHTDFYHRSFDVIDNQPAYSEPVRSEDLSKLNVSWNSSLADYSLMGPIIAGLYQRLRWSPLLRAPRRWTPASSPRPIKFSARFGTSHTRATVRFQRQRMREIVGDSQDTKKLGRRAYFQEMERSTMVIAPFGWGEITLRDFEAFIAGSAVIKPDMDHMETWPDLYQDGVTVLTCRWDLTGLADLLERVSDSPEEFQTVAASGQDFYRNHLVGERAAIAFAERFAGIVNHT